MNVVERERLKAETKETNLPGSDYLSEKIDLILGLAGHDYIPPQLKRQIIASIYLFAAAHTQILLGITKISC